MIISFSLVLLQKAFFTTSFSLRSVQAALVDACVPWAYTLISAMVKKNPHFCIEKKTLSKDFFITKDLCSPKVVILWYFHRTFPGLSRIGAFPNISFSSSRCLIHFSPVSHFHTPWKLQKTFGFLKFSGGIEMWHWTKMG